MSGRRLLAAASAAVVLLGGAGAFIGIRLAGDGGGRIDGGPIAPPKDAGYYGVGHAAPLGQRLSYGILVAGNAGDATAVLERVEAVETTPGMRIVGSYAQPPGKGPGVGLLEGFPPTPSGTIHARVNGYAVRPHEDFRIVLGVTTVRDGMQMFHKLRLYYRAGGHRYVSTWPLGLRLCSPPSRYLDRCPAPRSTDR